MTQPNPKRTAHRVSRSATWIRGHAGVVTSAVVIIGLLLAVVVTRLSSASPRPAPLEPLRYLGVYERTAPRSYTSIDKFARAIGKQPNLATYYSSWLEPFQVGFATAAAKRGAIPLVQINPDHVRLAAIASGRYDDYLRTFAAAVRSYNHQVIVGFGHEMNGSWFSWGYRNTSPTVFVAAWRHIVTVFHGQGARNVTWLWTINIIDPQGGISSPAPWWPGSSYVTWVGIDGYYFKPSWSFAPLFGPTIKAVRTLTHDPILIAETGAGTAAGQPAKIADLFAGIRAYGLLGFVWFDAKNIQNWSLSSPAAVAAFRQGAKAYKDPHH